MAKYIERLKEKQNLWNKVCKDRLDFGFDSIYFRYAEIVEELSWFKEKEAFKNGKNFDRDLWKETHLMHFYGCLEQLLQAHVEEDKNDINR